MLSGGTGVLPRAMEGSGSSWLPSALVMPMEAASFVTSQTSRSLSISVKPVLMDCFVASLTVIMPALVPATLLTSQGPAARSGSQETVNVLGP